MEKLEFLDARRLLLDELEGHKKRINDEYSDIAKKYLKKNTPVKIHKVYETKIGRKVSRVVVYSLDVQVLFSSRKERDAFVLIHAGVWVLDKESVPTKWKNFTIGGDLSNPQELTLSDDQTNHPVPENLIVIK